MKLLTEKFISYYRFIGLQLGLISLLCIILSVAVLKPSLEYTYLVAGVPFPNTYLFGLASHLIFCLLSLLMIIKPIWFEQLEITYKVLSRPQILFLTFVVLEVLGLLGIYLLPLLWF